MSQSTSHSAVLFGSSCCAVQSAGQHEVSETAAQVLLATHHVQDMGGRPQDHPERRTFLAEFLELIILNPRLGLLWRLSHGELLSLLKDTQTSDSPASSDVSAEDAHGLNNAALNQLPHSIV